MACLWGWFRPSRSFGSGAGHSGAYVQARPGRDAPRMSHHPRVRVRSTSSLYYWLVDVARGAPALGATMARVVRELAECNRAQEDEPDDEHPEDDVPAFGGGVQ